MTFEDAKKAALEIKPNIDNFKEMSDAFIFGSTEDAGKLGPGPVVIMKENGQAISMAVYCMLDGPIEVVQPLQKFDGTLIETEG